MRREKKNILQSIYSRRGKNFLPTRLLEKTKQKEKQKTC